MPAFFWILLGIASLAAAFSYWGPMRAPFNWLIPFVVFLCLGCYCLMRGGVVR